MAASPGPERVELPELGELLDGKLELVRRIGLGGMGAVFEARHLRTERRVAVKVLRAQLAADPEMRERMLQEALAGGRIDHPNVVGVLDAGVDRDRPFLVMELLRGESLAARIAREGRLGLDAAARVGLEAAAGLGAAHQAGILHRDVKPENLFLAEPAGGGEPVVKVVDFGISKYVVPGVHPSFTRTGMVMGTPHYMAPEQARGVRDVDARVDVYALGAVLYCALTGRPPFDGDNYNALLSAILSDTPAPPRALRPELPPAVEALLLRALERDRDGRYRDMGELAAALAEATGLSPGGARPALRPVDPRGETQPVASRPAAAAASVAAALAATTPTPAAAPLDPPAPSGAPRGAIADPAPRGAIAAPAPRRRLAARLALLALPALVGGALLWRAPPTRAPVRRLAVLVTRDRPDGTLVPEAWALASRLVEEIDHYAEFRPVSPAGMLAARLEVLGSAEVVPDEQRALAVARSLGADTLAALAVSWPPGGDPSVAVHVVDVAAPASGVSTQRRLIRRADLDGDGPVQLGAELLGALTRQWGAPPRDERAAMISRRIPFDAFQLYAQANAHCVAGRYTECERLARDALAKDPANPLFHSLLACALSWQSQRDGEARTEAAAAAALRGQLKSGRDRAALDVDLNWVAAEAARARGDRKEAEARSRQAVASAHELAYVYREPIGFLYAGAAYDYLMRDRAAAKRMYLEGRRLAPSLYPAYYDEVKMLCGSDRRPCLPGARGEAAQILWSFIECYPASDMATVAKGDATAFALPRPSGPLPCVRPN